MKPLRLAWMLVSILLAACGGRALDAADPATPPEPPANERRASATAPETPRARILCTYNIHVGVGMDKVLDLQRIADVLIGQKVDVAGLQELDRGVRRTHRVDQTAELMRLTGMEGVFGKSIDFQGGEYGLAILTTGRILEHRHQFHPVGEEDERRSFLLAKIRFEDGTTLWAINTHLGLVAADRRAQTAALLAAAAELDAPIVLLGDFNETPDAPDEPIYAEITRRYSDVWRDAPLKSMIPLDDDYTVKPEFVGNTFRADAPDRRIDYIFLERRANGTLRRAWTGATLASDHIPLFAEVVLAP